MKTLVLYVFSEFNNRVTNFIDKCIFFDTNVDFVIISNNTEKINYNIPSYVNILYRDNVGYDFGGWSDALLQNNLYKNYDNFIFANSSIIGPFIPSYCKEKWTDIYTNMLKDNVKLFGSTINSCGDIINISHVQSYIFTMDKTTLEYLINCEIFTNKYENTFNSLIINKERLMSRKIIENGWNIGSFLPQFKDVDFTFKTKSLADYNINYYNCDPMYPQFQNVLWNKYELVFIKGNRDIVL
jgi:hypothetical protein